MTEAADANNSYAVRGQNAALQQRIKDGYPATKQWTSSYWIDAFRNRRGPDPMAPDSRCERAVPVDDGLFQALTHVVIPSEALTAMQATARVPAESHKLAFPHSLRIATDSRDFTHRFVSGNKRIRGHSPFVVQH
ncbi:MAG: hypothetical protein NVSMB52_06640 [Chloroflexota bacterium]